MDFSNGSYLRISKDMYKSNYFRWVLNHTDKIVLLTLMDSIITKNQDYSNGLLVANIKQETLLDKVGSGIKINTLRASLTNLHDLGVIIKIHSQYKHIRYLLGFRSNSDDWLYLIYALINKFEESVSDFVESKKFEGKNINQSELKEFRLNLSIKDLIEKNIDDPKRVFGRLANNGKTMFEILFGHTNYYGKPKVVSLERSPKSGDHQILAPRSPNFGH